MISPVAIAALVALILGFGAGWTVNGWRYEAAKVDAVEAAVEKKDENVQKGDTAAVKHETDKVRIKTEFQTIREEVERVIEKPVYRNICLDDDGLRQLGAAIDRQPAAPGKPSDAMPKADKTD